MGPLGLYVHLPFCRARCPYCDFAISLETGFERYVEALQKEIRSRSGGKAATIHFGGGTPSFLPPAMLGDILKTLRESFESAPDAEIAIEANPSDWRSFSAYEGLGINRLSVGAQSFHEDELKWLGRDHTPDDIRKARFPNLSLDLIYGLPGQTLEKWNRNLEEALALNPQHLSVYALTLTGAKMLEGPPIPPDEIQAEMALASTEHLEKAGLKQYEISNFAQPGFESRHNLGYWTFLPYLGFGMGAHSFLAPRRFSNVAQLGPYCERILAGKSAVGMEETLTEEQAALEKVFIGLRLAQGVELDSVPAEEAAHLEAEGLAERSGGRLRLTPRGRVVCDEVTGRLVPA